MAKGKQAAKAANRRLHATQDHVDRLTDQLAEAKIRARTAEAASREADLLRDRVRRLEAEVESGPDEAMRAKLGAWNKEWKEDEARRRRAAKELLDHLTRVHLPLLGRLSELETVEVLYGILPHTFAALRACPVEWIREASRNGLQYAGERVIEDPAERRRWQAYVRKERHHDSAVVSDMIDILEAVRVGFTTEEIMEMVPARFDSAEHDPPLNQT